MRPLLCHEVAGRGYLVLDGPTGTQLIARGYRPHPALWTARAALDSPALLRAVHRDYALAGADILTANTFRTTPYAAWRAGIEKEEARRLTQAAVALCHEASDVSGKQVWVAGSMAPLEDCYRPDLVPDASTLARFHQEFASWLLASGCRVVLGETLGTAREALAVTRAAFSAEALLISFITDESGECLLGGEPLLPAARACVAAGADAILVNCVHADVMDRAMEALQPLRRAGVILGAYANAARMRPGAAPEWQPDLRPVKEQARDYAWQAVAWAQRDGARILGSCCGTTPEHIRLLSQALRAALEK